VTILVSLPYWNAPAELLDKAIGSILSQTFTDLRLVVIGDGCEPPISGVVDDRLEVFVLPENRGRYFADAVAQAANPFEWWSPHDADDWSEDRRFADLWRRRAPGAVWSAVETDGSIHTLPRALNDLTPRLKQTGYHIGLYSAERIALTGGYHPGYRVGYDTLFNALIRMTGDVSFSPHPYYHRHKWEGSLTKAKRTGRGSAMRNEAVAKLIHLYALIYPVYQRGEIAEIAPMITRTIPIRLREQVAEQAELLRKRLA
jgi:glycosyltransferase involved in cell wall biosynthesis